MPYDINKIRENLQKAVSGKRMDPDEFKVPKVSEKTKYRFHILGPVMKGDKVRGGIASASMDNFFIAHGEHWINNRPYACPRVCSNEECELCSVGFSLMKKAKEENKPKSVTDSIRSQWMPSTSYYVNIFFTNFKNNPEELRGQVKYFKAPKTVLDIFVSALSRDDSGDAEDPQAYGVFFDEMKSFVFELEVVKEGTYNGYKSSKFLPNNGNPSPIVVDANGEPNMAAIKKILDNRTDMFTKIDKPDTQKISRLVSSILSGDDEEDEPKGGFDTDETAQVAKSESKSKAKKALEEEVGEHLLPSKGDDDDEPAPPPKKTEPIAKAKQETKKAPPPADDDDDLNVDDLLSQLSGDDD
jgi:hypothetical protein